MEDLQEVPVLAAVGKGLAVAGKAVAKGVAVAAKAGAKAAGGAAKGGAKAAKATGSAAKGAAKTATKSTKPASKSLRFKRPNIKSYKNPETGKVDIDRYRSDQAKYRKIKQDQKNRPDMSKVEPDSVGATGYIDRVKRGERKLKAIDKITQRKKANLKKGMQDAGDIAKKTADKAGEYGKKSTSAVTKGFGTTSFTKEGITFKDYLNKL